jgi:hypothetical protein
MAIPLTKEQQQTVDSKESTPPEVVDPRTGEAYVLIRADEYENVRLLADERAGTPFPGAGSTPSERMPTSS